MGLIDGRAVLGNAVGLALGTTEGTIVVGIRERARVGSSVGGFEGARVAIAVGTGDMLGLGSVGLVVGTVGIALGKAEGSSEGFAVGLTDGTFVGFRVGTYVG